MLDEGSKETSATTRYGWRRPSATLGKFPTPDHYAALPTSTHNQTQDTEPVVPRSREFVVLAQGSARDIAAAIVPGTAECLVHGDNFLNGNPGRLGGPHASWLQMSSGRWPRYDVPHGRRPSVRGGAGRRRPAPPRRSRRRERAAPAAAHRGAAQDRGAGPLGTVAALHDGARRTPGAGVARRHVARPAGDYPPLAPRRLPRVLATTLSAVGSTPNSVGSADPRDGPTQSA